MKKPKVTSNTFFVPYWLIFCGIITSMFIGFLIGRSKPPVRIETEVPMPCHVLQRFLNEQGYTDKDNNALIVDGKCGGATQYAWDSYINDRNAIRFFERR